MTAAATNCGLTPGLESGGDPATQYQKVIQPFDMTLLLSNQIDVAEAMIYNEYAQVLEATNPETGALYQPPISTSSTTTTSARRCCRTRSSRDRPGWTFPANRDIAVRFVRASLKGWIYCRDNPADCVTYALNAGSQLGAGHQAWQMNEVNALVWPSPLGVGNVDPVFWGQTVKVAKNAGIIKNQPGLNAYDASIVQEALTAITDWTRTARTSRRAPSRSPRAATGHRLTPRPSERAGPSGRPSGIPGRFGSAGGRRGREGRHVREHEVRRRVGRRRRARPGRSWRRSIQTVVMPSAFAGTWSWNRLWATCRIRSRGTSRRSKASSKLRGSGL